MRPLGWSYPHLPPPPPLPAVSTVADLRSFCKIRNEERPDRLPDWWEVRWELEDAAELANLTMESLAGSPSRMNRFVHPKRQTVRNLVFAF